MLPLGETDAEARQLVGERFTDAAVEWLDRRTLRSHPIGTFVGLVRRSFDDALLVAPDLRHPRLRLTALLLTLPRARRRWLGDRQGRLEPFTRLGALRADGPVVVRHLAACVAALVAAHPLLRLADTYLAVEARLGLRRLEGGAPARILYLRSQLWLGLRGGGSVAHTAGVVGGLRQAGVDVRVVASDRLEGVEVSTTVAPVERWFDGPLKEAEELVYNVAFVRAALAAARAFAPHAVYQRYEAFDFAGFLVSRLLRVPLVLEFNSSEVWKGRYWGGVRLVGLAALGERVNLRAADRVVVVSRVLGDALVAAGVPSHKVVVNPNGVDPRRFHPDVPARSLRERLGLDGRTVVGFSGTFGVWHGIPTLAAALPLVARARPEVRFLLVGDGPLRRLVVEAVERHSLTDRVVLPGAVPHDHMPAYLAACDVLLSPHGRQADGREFFGSPTKLYEYMAAGRAIVASGVGQIGDVLRDGETALLVPPDEPDALAAAVTRLVDAPGLRERLGRAARAQAEQAHTWRQNAERVLASLTSPVAIPRAAGGRPACPGPTLGERDA